MSWQKISLGLMVSIIAMPATFADAAKAGQGAAPADANRAHSSGVDKKIGNATFPTKMVYEKTDVEIKVGARVKADFNEDFNGKQPNTTYGLDPASIPLNKWDYDAARHGNFNTSLTASRISAEIKHLYGCYENYGYIELDFNGGLASGVRTSNNYVPRIRHAYAEISDQGKTNNFIVGQTWTHFADPDVNPWSANNIWPTFRTAQARYTRKLGHGFTFGLSIERPNTQTFQATNTTGGSLIAVATAASYVDNDSGIFNKSATPDVTMKLKYHEGGNFFSLRGVVRRLEAKTIRNGVVNVNAAGPGGAVSSFHKKQTGWGLGASAMIQIIKPLTFLFQVQGGKGIGRYIDDLANANAFDSYLQFQSQTAAAGLAMPNMFEALRAINFIGGFTITWHEKWETNIGGAFTKVSLPKNIALRNFNGTGLGAFAATGASTALINTKLVRGHINLVYNILPKTFLVGELEHYKRYAGYPTTYTGKDTRFVFSFVRNF